MKADSKELARESSANADQALRDPFAVDMFTSASASFETSSSIFTTPPAGEIESSPVSQSWNLRLPQVKPEQMEASAAIASLSPETYAQIQSSVVTILSRYSMNPPDQISFALVDLHEMDFSSEVTESSGPEGVFATFITEPNAGSISFELGPRFAAMLVDRMLGGDGSPPDNLRSLTRTERAVIEFLCLSSASELQLQTGEPLLSLQTISAQPPWLTSRISNSFTPSATSGSAGQGWKRGLVASLRIGIGEISGITRAYMSVGALSALDEAHRRLRAAQQTSDIISYRVAQLARYARMTRDLSLTVLVGKTDVTLHDLLELEAGDVMVVDRPSLRWRRQQFSGSLLLRVGDSDEAMITAEMSEISDGRPVEHSAAEASPQAGSLKVKVDAVDIAAPPRYAERVKMEEEAENAEAPAEGASLIEAVMLTVRVELAARRLRLDELSRLRANQILDLGCKATDPVDLIVDGRRIARGELVDIEGRLGVRITQVLV